MFLGKAEKWDSIKTKMMRVSPDGEPAATPGAPPPARAQAATARPELQADKVSLQGAEAIERAWQQTPAVRPDKVAKAKALLQAHSYPSEAVVDKVAALLAEHMADDSSV